MKEFIKKQGVSFYLVVAAVLLSLVGLISLFVNISIKNYAFPNFGWTIVFGILSLLLIAGGMFAKYKNLNGLIVTGIYFAALILASVCFGIILFERVPLAADLFTWDHSNTTAWSAFNSGMVCVGGYLLSAILLAVNAFFDKQS